MEKRNFLAQDGFQARRLAGLMMLGPVFREQPGVGAAKVRALLIFSGEKNL